MWIILWSKYTLFWGTWEWISANHIHATIEDPRMLKRCSKKLPKMETDTVIGFLDETAPQTTANTQRLWSFGKPTICKNTSKLRANTFGFYALNGNSIIDFEPNSKKESVCDFFRTIWKANIGKNIVIILDNFPSHKAKMPGNMQRIMESILFICRLILPIWIR